MANGTNGNRLTLWLIGLIFPAVAGIGTSAVHTIIGHDGRISVLETQYQAANQRLERIERKLDQLIDRQHQRN
jgi:hypothetical protein